LKQRLAVGASRCTSAGRLQIRPPYVLTLLIISVTKPRAITLSQLLFSGSCFDN